MKQFGWAYMVLTRIPEALVGLFHPLSRALFKLRNGNLRVTGAQHAELTSNRHFQSSGHHQED